MIPDAGGRTRLNLREIERQLVELRRALGWPVRAPMIVTAENEDSSGLETEIAKIAAASAPAPIDSAEDRTGVPETP